MRLYDYGPSQNCFKVRLLAALRLFCSSQN
jgi:hypothetical protein